MLWIQVSTVLRLCSGHKSPRYWDHPLETNLHGTETILWTQASTILSPPSRHWSPWYPWWFIPARIGAELLYQHYQSIPCGISLLYCCSLVQVCRGPFVHRWFETPVLSCNKSRLLTRRPEGWENGESSSPIKSKEKNMSKRWKKGKVLWIYKKN